MDAGFLNIVEIGQYFITKDTAEFSHSSNKRRSITTRRMNPREHQDLGPYWKMHYSHVIYGGEIRIWFVNKDSTHSWV